MAAGCLRCPGCRPRSASPATSLPIVVVTAGYALFQAANNTAVMADIGPDQRGVVSGLLNLSRNLGLITGASVMGAVFATRFACERLRGGRPGRRRRHARDLRRRGGAWSSARSPSHCGPALSRQVGSQH